MLTNIICLKSQFFHYQTLILLLTFDICHQDTSRIYKIYTDTLPDPSINRSLIVTKKKYFPFEMIIKTASEPPTTKNQLFLRSFGIISNIQYVPNMKYLSS